ncbi:hypothetical protein RJ639_008815 [Escallonia herrerae]|uniref:OTU domain-containing protein n=1 Tax=Escallonia herrerae TaxID=1293975 RepID=A0AA89AT74_9ASTE|nr:hypothetical protein RJ639_008815 [Escallonia herrerae]
MTERDADASASLSLSASASVSSSSSLNSSSHDTEDDPTIARILAEEGSQSSGGKLGKRLSHLDSIPHTPRVNGEIPDVNDATLDHERLSGRLETYGLTEMKIEGDGNCQLKRNRKLYEGYVPMNYKSYLKKMKRLGEWGDHVTLQAAADRVGFEAKICLVTSFRDTYYIEIFPKDKEPLKAEDTLGILGFVRISCGLAFGAKFIIIHSMEAERFLLEYRERSIGFSEDSTMSRYSDTSVLILGAFLRYDMMIA